MHSGDRPIFFFRLLALVPPDQPSRSLGLHHRDVFAVGGPTSRSASSRGRPCAPLAKVAWAAGL
jgi:hypothetical protein